jgi:hypothetical protein
MLVFQYGSNTEPDRLNSNDRLRGDAVDHGLVRTAGNFELWFDVWSHVNACAAADIQEGGDHPVWGVVYDIPDFLISRETSGARKSLDAIEGVQYERRSIAVMDPMGAAEPSPVVTYTAKVRRLGLRTSLAYVAHIIRGLRSHNAPREYVAYVKQRIVANNPDLSGSVDAL